MDGKETLNDFSREEQPDNEPIEATGSENTGPNTRTRTADRVPVQTSAMVEQDSGKQVGDDVIPSDSMQVKRREDDPHTDNQRQRATSSAADEHLHETNRAEKAPPDTLTFSETAPHEEELLDAQSDDIPRTLDTEIAPSQEQSNADEIETSHHPGDVTVEIPPSQYQSLASVDDDQQAGEPSSQHTDVSMAQDQAVAAANTATVPRREKNIRGQARRPAVARSAPCFGCLHLQIREQEFQAEETVLSCTGTQPVLCEGEEEEAVRVHRSINVERQDDQLGPLSAPPYCVVCLSQQALVILSRCNHVVCCFECAHECINVCPICEQ